MLILNLLNKLKNIITNIEPEHILHVINYLDYYGYLDKLETESFIDGLKRFQGFFGLKQDGVLGQITLEETYRSRCGRPDFEAMRENLEQYMWGRKTLTYYIKSRLSNISTDDFDLEIEGAMEDVMGNCDIKISRTSSQNANLIIDTGNSRREELGSPNGVLAFAYLPTPSSSQILMKFDESENWTTNINESGIWLRAVARHEISGHMMGLSHSNDRRSLLYPMYQRSVDKLQSVYDIPELVKRYGKSQIPTPPTPIPPIPPMDPTVTTINIIGKVDKITIPGYRVTKLS